MMEEVEGPLRPWPFKLVLNPIRLGSFNIITKRKRKGEFLDELFSLFSVIHIFSRMMEKIWSKFNKKKEGEERVGTPVGHWTMNRSFSPTKSDSESNKLDSLQNLKSTPGRKSIG